jgi:hypothetical protein
MSSSVSFYASFSRVADDGLEDIIIIICGGIAPGNRTDFSGFNHQTKTTGNPDARFKRPDLVGN